MPTPYPVDRSVPSSVSPHRAMLARLARFALGSAGVALIAFSLLCDTLFAGNPGFGRGQFLLLGCGILMAIATAMLPGPICLKAVIAILSAAVTLCLLDVLFWLFGYDFGQRAAFEAVPIYYRRPTVPVGPYFFRRPGPAAWHGKVMTSYLRGQGWPANLLPREEPIKVNYDRNGFRNEDDLTEWQIAVVGDSFVELGYLPFEQLYTTRLAVALNRKVKNLGVAQTGPLTHIFYLNQYGKSHALEQALLVFYEGNDLCDLFEEDTRRREYEANRRRIHYRDPDAGISLFAATRRWFSDVVMAYGTRVADASFQAAAGDVPIVTGILAPDPDKLGASHRDLLSSAIRQWGAAVRSLGANPWLAYIPCKRRVLDGHLRFTDRASAEIVAWRPTNLSTLVKQMCDAHDVDWLDLTPILVAASARGELTYNTIDSHLNARGSEIVAEVLADTLRPATVAGD